MSGVSHDRQMTLPGGRYEEIVASTWGDPVDRDYGPWTGVSKERVIARWGSVDDAPGVEAKSVVRERAVAGLTDIAGRYRGGLADGPTGIRHACHCLQRRCGSFGEKLAKARGLCSLMA